VSAETRFEVWLNSARGGEQYIYYTGFLGDRVNPPTDSDKAEAMAAIRAFSEGRVELAQRRIKHSDTKAGAGVYQYLAQRRRRVQIPLACGNPRQLKISKYEWERRY
jgi:hypothetical protein